MVALVAKLLRSKPPANYALIASEILRRHGWKMHRASIRRHAIDQGIAPPSRSAKGPRTSQRRWQRQSIGELWQLDCTPHPWFGPEQAPAHLLNMLDDCSRLNTGARLYETENLLAYLDFLPRAFLEHGLPLELYVDYHSFFFTHIPEALTQLGAALHFYEVHFRYAPTPQAKGKIERHHQYWQGRLPSLLAAENIQQIQPANQLLEALRAHHNSHETHRELGQAARQAWDQAKRENRSVIRPVPCCPWWPYVWSLRTNTRVTEDRCLVLGQQRLGTQLPRGQRVVRCLHPDGAYTVLAGPPTKGQLPEILFRLGPPIEYPWS
jgi:hypothetical protein